MPGIGIGLSMGLGGGAGGGASLAADKASYLSSVSAGTLIATLADPFGAGSTFSVVGSAPSTLALAAGGRIVAGAGAQAAGVTSTIVIRASKGQRAIEEPLAFTTQAAGAGPTISGVLPAAIIGQAYDASLTVTPGGSAITLDSATLAAIAARNIAHNGFGRFTSAGVTA